MSPRGHVEHLFSPAYDGELGAREGERFQQHVEGCAACAAAYADFSASVDALRGLAPARMPRKVHLPSTSPLAERHVLGAIGLSWRRLLPRAATIAAAAAALAIVAINVIPRTGGSTPGANSGQAPLSALAPNPVAGSGSSATASGCGSGAGTLVLVSPPAGFNDRATASDSSAPAEQLVLATATNQVAAGDQVAVYAELTLPRAAAAAPGATTTPPVTRVVPCLTVNLGGRSQSLDVTAAAPPAVLAPNSSGSTERPFQRATASPLITFTVPAGTPPGTVLRVTATAPAGDLQPGQQPLSADLVITVR